MKKQHAQHASHGVVVPPAPKLHLVKGGKKTSSAIEASQANAIFEQLGLSPPNEIEPSSSETNNGEKSPEHAQAIKDVELLRAGKINRTELRRRYASTYTNWSGMKQRCRADPKTGIPAIALHPSYVAFADFLAVMGPRPFPTWSVDRIDPTGPYSPDNVRWASKTTQARNRTNTVTLTYKGETRPLVEWAELLGIDADTLRGRKNAGWTDTKIIEGKRLWDADNRVGPLSSNDWAYTPWPEGGELNWERQYQRDRTPSEHRLRFMLRYAQQRLYALQDEIESLCIPDEDGHCPRTIAEQTRWDKALADEKRWRTIWNDANHKQRRINEGEKPAFHTVPEHIANKLEQATAKS